MGCMGWDGMEISRWGSCQNNIQMMMGGDHKYAISPEEYIFAALAIYLDIINIFMYLLRLIITITNFVASVQMNLSSSFSLRFKFNS